MVALATINQKSTLRIGMVAGEASGDNLGAGLLKSLNNSVENLEVVGIGGTRLIDGGMKVLYPMERLSVMGFTEVLSRYFELRRIRKNILQYFLDNPPDVFIGVDAPDFNLWLEKKLKQAGILTVHYVSPSVWAWREYRIRNIVNAVDLMLNLFPFESSLYDKYAIPNCYVGHPLADELKSDDDLCMVRNKLALEKNNQVVALLPGSRISEIKKIAPALLLAAKLTKKKYPDIVFISGLLNEKTREQFLKIKNKLVPDLEVQCVIGKTHQVMQAADVILLASGTATLEAMFLNKPMVVVYKLSWLTHAIVKRLAKIPYASLPNILANKLLVPECLQENCTPQNIYNELSQILDSDNEIQSLKIEFARLVDGLGKQANVQAAAAVIDLIEKKSDV